MRKAAISLHVYENKGAYQHVDLRSLNGTFVQSCLGRGMPFVSDSKRQQTFKPLASFTGCTDFV